MSLTKSLHVVFDLKMIGLSEIWHHIIKVAAEVLAPGRTSFNNGNFHYLVITCVNIPPIITKLTCIYNSDVEYCQEVLVVGK